MARILLDSGVPTVVLRAAVIIGSGSASFEMLRYLTERLPVMVTPRWVKNRIQPIAVRDVLRYLIAAAELPAEVNRGFDIGGPDVLTYLEMMQRYARVAGLRRRIIVPLRPLSPWLSAHWVGAITPVPNAIARPLVASLIHEAIAHEHDIARYVPDEGLLGFDEAVRLALGKVRDANVETRWSTAVGRDAAAEPLPSDPDWSGGSVYVDERSREVDAPVGGAVAGHRGRRRRERLVLVPARLVGARLAGPAGRRRRPAPRPPRPAPPAGRRGAGLVAGRGDHPGRAAAAARRDEGARPGLAGDVRGAGRRTARSVYRQRAVFVPRGLAGHAYWASVAAVPRHRLQRHGPQHRPGRRAGHLDRTLTTGHTGLGGAGRGHR